MILMKREIRCIICGEKKSGLEVREDIVIQGIRWFKRNITRDEKGYGLIVCKDCYPSYIKARRKFEKRQAFYIAIGVIFAALIFLASTNKFIGLFYGIGIIAFVYLLTILTYVPALNMPEGAKTAEMSTKSRGVR